MRSNGAPLKVKLSVPWRDFPLLRQTPGGTGMWGATEFTRKDDGRPFDWWVVTEGLVGPERLRCPSGRRVLVTWEPPCRPDYRQEFLDQFDVVVTCHRNLRHPRVVLVQPGFPWFVERSYDQLLSGSPPEKPRLLSIITSNKVLVEGHRIRLELAHALKDHFGDEADLFGRGIRDFDDKWDVLAPYRYTVAVENEVAPDYITEKLTDCFLTETFPFYGGAPNAADWFPPASFAAIDPSDIEECIGTIERTLADAEHLAAARPALREARRRYLDEQQFFPLIDGILRGLADGGGAGPVERLMLRPEHRGASRVERGARRAARILGRRG